MFGDPTVPDPADTPYRFDTVNCVVETTDVTKKLLLNPLGVIPLITTGCFEAVADNPCGELVVYVIVLNVATADEIILEFTA
jgi:hypothetical protein